MSTREQMIEAYLPNPRDPELSEDEYYVRDRADRVRKVTIVNILPWDDATEYEVMEVSTWREVRSWRDGDFRGFRMGEMYDNRKDCKNMTHDHYDGWESLRRDA